MACVVIERIVALTLRANRKTKGLFSVKPFVETSVSACRFPR